MTDWYCHDVVMSAVGDVGDRGGEADRSGPGDWEASFRSVARGDGTVVAVAAGWRRTLGLRGDGAVPAAGRASEGACDVHGWREVVAISCGDWHSVGLRWDGTAVATGQQSPRAVRH